MKFKSWACLMVADGPGIIPEDVRAHLQFCACELYLRKQDRMKISGDNPCDGILETEWSSHTLGGLTGTMFRAHVTFGKYDSKINFLLSENDLKEGAKEIQKYCKENDIKWRSGFMEIPLPELYNFRDLKKTRLGKTLN